MAVIALCGGCHARIATVFEGSRHHQQLAAGELAPTCIDCHSTAGGVIVIRDMHRCEECHLKVAGTNLTVVMPSATDLRRLLDLLRQVTLARALVEERLVVAENRGADVSQSRAQLDETRKRFGNTATEWHRFDLQQVERRSHEALAELEAVNGLLDGSR